MTAGRVMPRRVPHDRSLAALYPELLAEWDRERNEDLEPARISPGSQVRAWWRCTEGHEWEATVNNRASHGRGCPYCAGQRVTSDRSLAALHPDLAAELRGADPATIGPRSNRRFTWRCARGHEWQATPANRTRGETGCPYCAGQRVTPERSLAALYPALAAELRDADPKRVAPQSDAPLWWRCAAGHEWEARVHSRVSGRGCPYCAGRQVTPERSLAALHPDLLAEWDCERNEELDPWSLPPRSGARAWWRCAEGHHWQAQLTKRTGEGTGCPICNRPVRRGVLLVEARPDLAEEWDRDLSRSSPADVTTGSGQKPWWRCPRDPAHRWRARVRDRVRGTGCPYCAHRRLAPEASLAAVLPALADQWHPERNADRSPSDVFAHSRERVWWRCAEGHEWEARIATRARGSGCPHCLAARPLPRRHRKRPPLRPSRTGAAP